MRVEGWTAGAGAATIMAAAAVLAGGATAQPVAAPPRAAAGDDLLGLWGGEALLGPQVRGELLLERQGRRWTARVAGFEVAADQAGDSVVLRLPGGQGTVRAWAPGAPRRGAAGEAEAGTPEGFWVQPADADGPPYATPLRFRAAGAGAWRATVVPLDARFPLYLWVYRAGDGALRGVFRNPAVNWPGRAGVYSVARDGEAVTFLDPRTGRPRYRQPYDSAQRTLLFDFGGAVVLTPRTREQAVGFVPRSPALPPYAYRPPAELADGWRSAPAHAVGVDEGALAAIVRGLVRADPLDDTLPRVHSLLVARRGRLVLDEYFYGSGPDQLHDLRSASKTITSVLAGAAMYRGARFDMDTAVAPGAGGAPITVGQLLAHTSGLACDDDDDGSPGNEDAMQAQRAQPDWYRFTLALPRAHPPGTTYAYCSAGINLVGHVVGRATGTWLPAFFDRAVARPLGIAHYAVNLMPTGEAYAGGGMQLRPRDFLKIGQLYLDGGVWRGVRVVSAAWVARSTARQADRPDGSSDGFGWHRHVLRVGARAYQTYEASGNGGQFVVVVPDLALVVATTAGNYGQYAAWRRIREALVPAVMAAVD
jgi:CubicO group peptidase (beta-lactamase class C family)